MSLFLCRRRWTKPHPHRVARQIDPGNPKIPCRISTTVYVQYGPVQNVRRAHFFALCMGQRVLPERIRALVNARDRAHLRAGKPCDVIQCARVHAHLNRRSKVRKNGHDTSSFNLMAVTHALYCADCHVNLNKKVKATKPHRGSAIR